MAGDKRDRPDERAAAIGSDKILYYEDVVVGEIRRVGSYTVSADEIVAFGLKWDPLPIHVDPAAAALSPFGTLTAPGTLILAIKQKLVHELPLRGSVVASLGFDEVRFLKPLRPGDRVSVEVEWLSKRVSTSNSAHGIVGLGLRLLNQMNEAVLSHRDTIMMRLGGPGSADEGALYY